MKKKQLKLLGTLIICISTFFVQGQGIIFKQTNESGVYKRGQKINIMALTPNHKGDSIKIRILINNRQEFSRKETKLEGDSLQVFEGSFGEPCSIIIEAKMKTESSSIGLIVEPEKIKPGVKSPQDFDTFWKDQKKALKALPMEVKSNSVSDLQIEKGYDCADVEINCLGPRPARGYFAKPQNAALKSLPIVIFLHAAGVKSSWCQSEPQTALKYARLGALGFDLNAHGMLNGQADSYYNDLEKGELRNYADQGLTSREDCYFLGMYLRLMRTIDFLTKQPEWDGKRIMVIGQSQGGGQALAAAGLDKRVSAVVAILPAMCDWGGKLDRRQGGWPQPFEKKNDKDALIKVLSYFDNAHLLKGTKATIVAEIGLIDMTCPSTSVFAAINQAKGKKIIYTVPYRAHENPQKEWVKKWEEAINTPRETFIQNYLKTKF